jgi:hypothetical protein
MKNKILIFVIILGCFACMTDAKSQNPKFRIQNSEFRIQNDSLPADFPKLKIDTSVSPAPGYLVMESIGLTGETGNYLIVLDSNSLPFYYKKLPTPGIDFKMQPNGLFSYGQTIKGVDFQVGPITIQNAMVIDYILKADIGQKTQDKRFEVIDSVQCANGYLSDTHDFRILPNGNYLMLVYEYVPWDMSLVVKGGNPNATLMGAVIQELDINKKCIFQWRSLDHIDITETEDNLLNAAIDLVHVNSFELDTDGNLIVSLASSCEIIKIDMVTGNILWRFGGQKSDFAISGEHEENKPLYFSLQHDVKRLENGNFLFYDNGLNKEPSYSRAVEYSLDEENKKANLVWEYRRKPDISSFAMGSIQRFPNGNTLIDWGIIFSGEYRSLTEINPDKSLAFELSLPSDAFTYRAYKYLLPACQPVGNVRKANLSEGFIYSFNNDSSKTGVDVQFEQITSLPENYFEIRKYDCSPLYPEFAGESPVVLPCRFMAESGNIHTFTGEFSFDVTQLPQRYNNSNLKIFYRPKEVSGIFKELETHFDTAGNKIVAKVDDFGEYILGFHRNTFEILPPALVSPGNEQMFINNNPITLVWSSTGRYDSFEFQVAEDSQFDKIILDSSNIKTPIINHIFEPNKTYFWRAKTFYKNSISGWSDIKSFGLSSPFISLASPNGGESWHKDSGAYIIRWKTNIKDSVSISLLRNGIKIITIKDSLFSFTDALAWKIPSATVVDSSYRIQIRSIKDSSLAAESEGLFAIKGKISDVDVHNEHNFYGLDQNIPNPAIYLTKINFHIGKPGPIEISIFDIYGNKIKVLDIGNYDIGNYQTEWDGSEVASGLYFCRLKAGENQYFIKIIVIK